jgi:hypothetical protein
VHEAGVAQPAVMRHQFTQTLTARLLINETLTRTEAVELIGVSVAQHLAICRPLMVGHTPRMALSKIRRYLSEVSIEAEDSGATEEEVLDVFLALMKAASMSQPFHTCHKEAR